MKTFDECINEKQNFIFGGKSGLTGKEYGTEPEYANFGELEKGDKVYLYEYYEDGKFDKVTAFTAIEIEKCKEPEYDLTITYGFIGFTWDVKEDESIAPIRLSGNKRVNILTTYIDDVYALYQKAIEVLDGRK